MSAKSSSLNSKMIEEIEINNLEEEQDVSEYPDRIAETFAGKTLLISGASGFMGKVLLEKLLRCCFDVNKIYVILRPKYNLTVRERLDKVFESPIFNKVKATQGFHIFQKIIPIEGDVSKINLGISHQNRSILIHEVQIVYHCAANVRFDETLRTAVLMNVRGTKCMLDLAKEMKNLLVFFHVSTAYCHLNEKHIYEQPYHPPDNPNKVLKIVETLEDDKLSPITHKILGDIPNTYTYTKALAEGLINEELKTCKYPIVLLRPSFVIPIWKDPIPGWTDTINGIIGFEIASGKGILRVMHTDENNYADFLPVDVAISAFLFAAFEYLNFQAKLPLNERHNIHNLITSSEYKVTWKDIKQIGKKVIAERVPLNWVVWYPDTLMTKNKYLYQFLALFQHLIPAIIIDSLLISFGYGSVLLGVHRRLLKGFDMMNYYGRNQWVFHNEWSLKSRELLNPRERQIYTLFGDGIDYLDYFTHCVMSARRHILKEPDDTLARAKSHLKTMFYVDLIFKIYLFYFALTKIYSLLIFMGNFFLQRYFY